LFLTNDRGNAVANAFGEIKVHDCVSFKDGEMLFWSQCVTRAMEGCQFNLFNHSNGEEAMLMHFLVMPEYIS